MDAHNQIAWVCLALLHQSMILESATCLFMIRARQIDLESDALNVLRDNEPPEMIPKDTMINQLALKINTLERAFNTVCAQHDQYGLLLTRNLPGNDGHVEQYYSNKNTLRLVRAIVDAETGGLVHPGLLAEMLVFYENQFQIFLAKFDEVLSDDESDDEKQNI